MGQFSVHANPNPASRDRIPYLVDLQSDLLADLPTRLVAPLYLPTQDMHEAPRRLCPVLAVAGRRVVLYPHEAAGIPLRALGKIVGDLRHERVRIVDALDAVISGV